ncbi:MAG: hypothetical protein ACOH2R_28265 [Pseudomonas sp.]
MAEAAVTPPHRTKREPVVPVLDLKHEVICDQCFNSRAHGNHKACSKKRQAMHAKLRESRS